MSRKKTENAGDPSSVGFADTFPQGGRHSGEAAASVYCGPSVRNVVRQYTVFYGQIPEALAQFLEAHPAAKSLLVPVDCFAQTRRALETRGTAEAVIYNKVKSEL